MIRFRLSVCFLVALCCAQSPMRAAGGFSVAVGPATVSVSSLTGGALHLRVSYGDQKKSAASVYLAPGSDGEGGVCVRDGAWMGIKSDTGSLWIDPVVGTWTLRDAHGKTLTPPVPIAELVKNPQTGQAFVLIHAGCAADRTFQAYGAGNGIDTLIQDHSTPRMGNGIAVTPYYWNDAGYAALGIAASDNTPPSWSASAALGRVTWIFPGTSADLYLMPAANLREAAVAYGRLGGTSPVPPRWTFGYMQSRWGWKDRGYIEDALHQFGTRRLPVDAFIIDFEWYTSTPDYSVGLDGLSSFHDFAFNPAVFPEPDKQIAELKQAGVNFVGIRKPRLGNSDYLAMARAKGWILPPGKSGKPIDARVLDFSKPDVRSWYTDQSAGLLQHNFAGWWDDEGEQTYTTYYWWNQAQADALAKARPGMRLWTINRTFSPGLQRFGASAWTGDNHATWAEFAQTATSLLNWSLAGMPYGSCDIGGHYGSPSPLLMTRWMQAGVFFPVMRTHSTFAAMPHFPWLFGQQAEDAIRKALDLRYRLVPYYYSLAHETQQTGVPMMRPLAMEFPNDPAVANLSDEWLMGRGLLAAPMFDANEERFVYLPSDTWYELGGDKALTGGQQISVPVKFDEIPVYVRAGTILPLGPVLQHTAELPGGPLELQIYPGHDGSFTLYEDDGLTTGYLSGQVRKTVFHWDDSSRTLRWSTSGAYAGKDVFRQYRVVLMAGPGKGAKTVEAANSRTEVRFGAEN